MGRRIFLRILSLLLSAFFGFWLGIIYECDYLNDQSSPAKVLSKNENDNISKWEEAQTAKFNREARKHGLKSPQCCKRRVKEHDLSRIQLRNVLRHIVVDRKNKLLYCYVPKVASSNMKRLMLTLEGRSESADAIKFFDQRGFEFLINFNATDRDRMMKTFFKFFFVRDPSYRLVSAYRNKFLNANAEFRHLFGRSIVTRYRKNNLVTSTAMKSDVPTFQEFLRYVIGERNEVLNEHWMPIYDLCQPCMISYDFIGSFENLELDVDAFLKIINATKGISFPRKQPFYQPTLTWKEISKYYESVTSTEYRNLRLKFLKDLKCFSYGMRNVRSHIEDS